MAVQNGHDATVRLLLDRGANLEATANGGWTALHLAADMGHEAVI
jgi:ankyrin repeat protein